MGIFNKIFGGGGKLDYKKRYELQLSAMSGTMSKVYKAKDRITGEIIALKILDMPKTNAINSRFQGVKKPTEGEIAIQFDHPFIIKTLSHGLTIDNEQYLIMEYLGGSGLNNVLLVQEDLMSGARLLYIRQIAEALAVVHDKGFIHRDICPRNLIFTEDGTVLKLTDFGLTVPDKSPFTDPGNRTGTANYMAPELVRRKPTDRRLDIFAFGVTIYELCTKNLPWPRGENANAAMSHSEPPEPITTYRPQINKTLAKAIHKCIEPEAAERFSEIRQFTRMIAKIEHEDE
ncbi:MAG: serine/threonine protein kinase [Planctomycetaceae bacterium]|jgi:serine/threonine-protein kinase|nr:serine/threonine protein kinase [Planctomycetaceae bacterium]